MNLSKETRDLLVALSDPAGKTYIGGFNLCAMFDAERNGLVAAKTDPAFPSFISYVITDAGRRAIKSRKPRP